MNYNHHNLFSIDTIVYITAAEAASILGVHKASIRNWIRHGYLNPVNETGVITFRREEVECLKQKIASGYLQRLNKRANKSTANKTFVPDEYSTKPKVISFVSQIAEFIVSNKLDVKRSLYYLALNVLHQNKSIELLTNNNSASQIFNTKNLYLHQQLTEWMRSLPHSTNTEPYDYLLKQTIPPEEDILGLIYQSILVEGQKAKKGSYYTPKNIVLSIIKDYLKPGLKVLDPCCGTGRFLLTAASFTGPEYIYGFDIDLLAVRIARINLMIKYPQKQFSPNIFCYNTLLNLPVEFDESFDVITSNPPWGMHLQKDEAGALKRKYPEINSGESFSYFIRKGTNLLKKEGVLSFILPEAILYVKTHKDIRKYILDNYIISAIYNYGSLFKNVFTKVIRIDLKRIAHYSADSRINVVEGSVSVSNLQKALYENPDYRFSFHLHEHSRSIISRVYNLQHTTLKKQADWALGIVTGDNKKFLSPVKLDGYEEVYTGREVSAYKLNEAKTFLNFQPDLFQQVAPVEKYRTREKLIYKFISNKLIFAYDNRQRLTLNSANIMIPKIPDYPLKTILALLNSPIYQFIFKQKFNSIKVLRSHLEILPFPIWSDEIHKRIDSFVDMIFKYADIKKDLDRYICELFELNGDEINFLSK